jgi:hypothetical protein
MMPALHFVGHERLNLRCRANEGRELLTQRPHGAGYFGCLIFDFELLEVGRDALTRECLKVVLK